jgi:hypothetical protein
LAVGAPWPTTRSLTYSELEQVQVTAPIVRLVTGAPAAASRSWLGAARVWADYGDGRWHLVGLTSAIANEAANDQPAEMLILLTAPPRAVRVGLEGYYTGPYFVDHLELIMPDGSRVSPAAAVAVNAAANPEQAIGADGKVATLSHTAPAMPGTPTAISAVDLLFPEWPAQAQECTLRLPEVPLKPAHYGVYCTANPDSDPHNTPAGWVYQPSPADTAFYDFTVPQSNTPPFFAAVKTLNPQHVVVARLTWPRVNPLDYWYKEDVRQQIAAAIREQLGRGTELLHGVYLGDEEPAHFLDGWYSGGAPEWLTRYQAEFEKETGKTFQWGSPALTTWVMQKGQRFWDDLYALIKSIDPKLKVMPFLYVPDDISGWGFWDPGTIKADGWVNQWYDNDKVVARRLKCKHADAAIPSVWVLEDWFSAALGKLRQAGVPLEEIYCQVWAYQTTDHAIAQIEKARQAGITNFFIFYCNAWIPPALPELPRRRDLAFRLTAEGEAAPAFAQEAAGQWSGVGVGVAQSFVAGKDSLSAVSLLLRSAQAESAYAVAIHADNDGLPAAEASASAPLATAAEFDGWVTVPLKCALKVGGRYHLVIRPVGPAPAAGRQGPRPELDDQGNLKVGISLSDPYPGGELIQWETYAGYYDTWRPIDPNRLSRSIGPWASSYRQRLELESYIREMRTLGR